MQAKLGALLQKVNETKKALPITEDKRDKTSKLRVLAMMELNATNDALIRLKANSVLISTFQPTSNHSIHNITMTRLPTYNGTITLDTFTSFLSTLHRHFGPHAQELG